MQGLVVVTGANGHIGNNLCRELIEKGTLYVALYAQWIKRLTSTWNS